MYNLLIVDDEDIIRKGLKILIEDLGIQFSNILEAEDGEKALNIVEKFEPEIILTDVKMPNMDGIELIKRIRQKGLNSRIIILTGYNEFEYAKEAIHYKVSEYLLKPVSSCNVATALNNIIQDIDEEELIRMSEAERDKYLRKIQLNLIQKKAKDILFGIQKEEISFLEFLKQNNIHMSLSNFAVLYAQIKEYRTTGKHADVDEWQEILGKRLKCRLSDIGIASYILTNINNGIIAVINFNDNVWRDIILKFLESFNSGFLKENLKIYWGISQKSTAANDVTKLFRQSKNAILEKVFYKQNCIFFTDDVLQRNNKINVTESDIIKIVSLFETGSNDKMSCFLNGIFCEKDLKSSNTVKNYVDALCEIIIRMVVYLKKNENINSLITNDIQEFIESIAKCDYLMDINKNFIEILLKIRTLLNDKEKVIQGRKSINLAKQFIQQNFHLDLNLDMIANYVSMNYAYFSVLFKRLEGISLIDYIINIRINKAMEYLRDPQYKVYEVADMIGFNDEKYFSKVFKKKTGISPKEYRDNSFLRI